MIEGMGGPMGLNISKSEFQQLSRLADQFIIGVALLVGTVFLLVGVGFACSSISVVSVAKQTEGKVIRNVVGWEGGAAAVVEFFLDGQRHEIQSSRYTSPPQFKIGDKVSVLYDPNDPRRCRINSFVDLWLFPTIFGGIGLLVVTLSGTALVVKRVRRQRRPSSATAENETLNYLDPKGSE